MLKQNFYRMEIRTGIGLVLVRVAYILAELQL